MINTEQLIKKLNNILDVNEFDSFVSPTTSGSVTSIPRNTLFITQDFELDMLTENELLYVHTLLHKLYNSKQKNITKEKLKQLHSEIRVKINHVDFDKLDKNAK